MMVFYLFWSSICMFPTSTFQHHFLILLMFIILSILMLSVLIFYAHPLVKLLSFEGGMLSILAVLILSSAPLPLVFFLCFFTLAVTEASGGLGVLIKLTRTSLLSHRPPY